MIFVTGSIVARQETLDELVKLSLEHVERSRREPGCLTHTVHREIENPLRLVFLETWEDREALEAHFQLQTSRQFVAEAMQLASEPPAIAVYDAQPLDVSL